MKKTIYVSGKISGDDDYRAKFHAAALRLSAAGYRVLNPASITESAWKAAMREALTLMLGADGVAALPDWYESRGAKIEARLACDLGIPVKTLDRWCEEGNEHEHPV